MTISTHTITITLTTTLCSALVVLTGACDRDRDSERDPTAPGIVRFQSDTDPGDTDPSSGDTDPGDTDPGDTDPGDTDGELMERTPWLVSIQRAGAEGLHWCSGAIIRKEWVLTAAHCVEDRSAATLQVVAGIDRFGDPGSEETRRGVEQIVVHPGYAPRRLGHDHDLALLRLDEPLDVSGAEVSAIELGTLADLEPTKAGQGVVSGWGRLSSGEEPDALEVIAVDLLSNAEARDVYGTPIVVEQIASAWEEGMTTCQADSGGPLVLETLPEPRLVGVASEGTACADPSSPQIYARVSSYLEWIDSEVGAS